MPGRSWGFNTPTGGGTACFWLGEQSARDVIHRSGGRFAEQGDIASLLSPTKRPHAGQQVGLCSGQPSHGRARAVKRSIDCHPNGRRSKGAHGYRVRGIVYGFVRMSLPHLRQNGPLYRSFLLPQCGQPRIRHRFSRESSVNAIAAIGIRRMSTVERLISGLLPCSPYPAHSPCGCFAAYKLTTSPASCNRRCQKRGGRSSVRDCPSFAVKRPHGNGLDPA
jgi:hypothetical protein